MERVDTSFRLTQCREVSVPATASFPFVLGEACRCDPVIGVALSHTLMLFFFDPVVPQCGWGVAAMEPDSDRGCEVWPRRPYGPVVYVCLKCVSPLVARPSPG